MSLKPSQKLEAIEDLVRTIVIADMPNFPAAKIDELVYHISGALFVYMERPYKIVNQEEDNG
jgi:hypothetical protein